MIDGGPSMERCGAATRDERPARARPRPDDDRAVAARREAAGAERSEARRRFLLGGGAALSALATVSPGRAGAVAHPGCAAGMDWMTMSLEARNLAYTCSRLSCRSARISWPRIRCTLGRPFLRRVTWKRPWARSSMSQRSAHSSLARSPWR
jgi:hypothetical protein